MNGELAPFLSERDAPPGGPGGGGPEGGKILSRSDSKESDSKDSKDDDLDPSIRASVRQAERNSRVSRGLSADAADPDEELDPSFLAAMSSGARRQPEADFTRRAGVGTGAHAAKKVGKTISFAQDSAREKAEAEEREQREAERQQREYEELSPTGVSLELLGLGPEKHELFKHGQDEDSDEEDVFAHISPPPPPHPPSPLPPP